MECLLLPRIPPLHSLVAIPAEEAHHLKVLRLGPGDHIMAVDGRGTRATLAVDTLGKKEASARVVALESVQAPAPFLVACGLLQVKDRFEWAVEKAVELGATGIIPLLCDRSQRSFFTRPRVQAKADAALKQCKRAWQCAVLDPLTVEQALAFARSAGCGIVLADAQGAAPAPTSDSVAVFIGPEGGFSTREEQVLADSGDITRWVLADARLRAETAAVAACSAIAAARAVARVS
jgi:16S rRNA (uracil1498-N3)-methyltransferase